MLRKAILHLSISAEQSKKCGNKSETIHGWKGISLAHFFLYKQLGSTSKSVLDCG